MTKTRWVALYTLSAFPILFAINYGLALIGEPRALWLMKLLGIL